MNITSSLQVSRKLTVVAFALTLFLILLLASPIVASSGLEAVSQASRASAADLVAPSAREQEASLRYLNGFGGNMQGIVISDSFAFVGEGHGVTVFDISDPGHPARRTKIPLRWDPESLESAGHFLYVSLGPAGMQIIDVSDPLQPRLRGRYRGPETVFTEVIRTAVRDNLAYLVGNRFEILDLSNPDHPTLLASYELEGEGTGIQVVGERAYVLQSSKLDIYDVSDPNAGTVIGTYYDIAEGSHLWVGGNLAFVADSGITVDAGLLILDVSDGSNPTLLGSYEKRVTHVQVDGELAYVAEFWGEMDILDVSNPAAPVKVGTYSLSCNQHRGLQVVGNRLYVVGLCAGLQVVEVSDPANPALLGSYNTHVHWVDAVEVVDNVAYLSGFNMGLALVDVSNPHRPTLLGVYFKPEAGHVSDMHVADDLVYLVNKGELQIFDVSDPGQPQLLGSSGRNPLPSVFKIEVVGDRVYGTWCCNTRYEEPYGGLHIIDVSDPANPRLEGSYEAEGAAAGVAVADGVAYVGHFGASAGDSPAFSPGLEIVDVRDPTQPTQIMRYDGVTGTGIEIEDNLLYVAHGLTLDILDIRNRTAPEPLGHLEIPRNEQGYVGQATLRVVGNFAYMAGELNKVHVVDIRDPANPLLYAANRDAVYFSMELAVAGNMIYVADDRGGLQILQLGSASESLFLPFVGHR